MGKELVRCLENARHYQLKRWATNVALSLNHSLAEQGVDLRDKFSLREYLLAHPQQTEQAID